jgi:hypothetical protein
MYLNVTSLNVVTFVTERFGKSETFGITLNHVTVKSRTFGTRKVLMGLSKRNSKTSSSRTTSVEETTGRLSTNFFSPAKKSSSPVSEDLFPCARD